VINGIVVGQAVGEDGEGRDLALRGAGDGEFAPAVGDDAGHGGVLIGLVFLNRILPEPRGGGQFGTFLAV
jgi:hypothetical protein